MVLPFPSCPDPLLPQAQTVPSDFAASPWFAPAAWGDDIREPHGLVGTARCPHAQLPAAIPPGAPDGAIRLQHQRLIQAAQLAAARR